MSQNTTPAQSSCSFCGKAHTELDVLIAGPAVSICNECVRVCDAVVRERTTEMGHCVYVSPPGESYSTSYERHIVPMAEDAGLTSAHMEVDAIGTRVVSDLCSQVNAARILLADLTEDDSFVAFVAGVAAAGARGSLILMHDKASGVESPLLFDITPVAYRLESGGFEAVKRVLTNVLAVEESRDEPGE